MNKQENITLLSDILKNSPKLTPMMEQFVEIKKQYPTTILLFRMGDFYEMFFEDAISASKILGIALTHRGKIGDYSIPMAGIPYHAANSYIDKITSAGLKAVICEQIEDPKMAQGIVKRAVTQIVSPSIPFDIEKTENKTHYYIGACHLIEEFYFLSLVDFTTGDFLGFPKLDITEMLNCLLNYAPKEMVCFFDQWENTPNIKEQLEKNNALLTYISEEYFNPHYNENSIEKLIPLFKSDSMIGYNQNLLPSIAALSYYLQSTGPAENLKHIKPYRIINNSENTKISFSTLRGLEILPRNKENYQDSLIGFIDKTISSMGSRKLKDFFLNPMRDKVILNERYRLIDFFIKDKKTFKSLRDSFKDIRDIPRILTKVNTHKAIPGDFINLANALESFKFITKEFDSHTFPLLFDLKNIELKEVFELSEKILFLINPELGSHWEKGNFIKEGCLQNRDELARKAFHSMDIVRELEEKYRKEYNLSKLKIKSNNINGYFIEISKQQTSLIPDFFVRKQTLVNAERYQTKELQILAKEVNEAKELLVEEEREIAHSFTEAIKNLNQSIHLISDFLANLDVYLSFAWISYNENFARPSLNDENKMHIEGSFHPLIKKQIKERYVTHTLSLNQNKFFALITGPNMAGKTTVMREVAICQFLAQIGCYVPALSADLFLCDYIFSRLGASDDILNGQSTFMVEMSETAEILRHATSKSLILLDEIGRGTSTFDGLSIAWALVEHIAKNIRAITLFSTHYHELIELADSLLGVQNFTVKTIQQKGKVKFLYELIEEGATQSFGIYVAELAGIPKEVLERAQVILKDLEQKSHSEDLPIFQIPINLESEIENEMRLTNLNELTPIEALNLLVKWQNRLKVKKAEDFPTAFPENLLHK